jgi:DNA-directed RNA polymerase subunit H (RpoH/RPB5)
MRPIKDGVALRRVPITAQDLPEIEPDDGVVRAMPVRLSFVFKRGQRRRDNAVHS